MVDCKLNISIYKDMKQSLELMKKKELCIDEHGNHVTGNEKCVFRPIPEPVKTKDKCLSWIKACNSAIERSKHKTSPLHLFKTFHRCVIGPAEENPNTVNKYCKRPNWYKKTLSKRH